MKLSLLTILALSLPLCGRAANENTAAMAKPVNEWMETHEGYVQRARQGGVEVVFLGDSITQRWNSAGREVWAAQMAPLKAVNFGIGGDRTENVLWRVRNGEFDGITPKAVVLLIGTNNLKMNTSAEIAEAIGLIVQEIRQRAPQARILLLGILPRGEKPGEMRTKLGEVNQAVAKLDDGMHVFYLDIGDKLLQPDGTIAKSMMLDFLHPEKPGYEIMAAAIRPKLAEFLK